MFLGSANRDPRRWENPDAFDLARNPSGHVGFRFGIHQCVGQHIARTEAAPFWMCCPDGSHQLNLRANPQTPQQHTQGVGIAARPRATWSDVLSSARPSSYPSQASRRDDAIVARHTVPCRVQEHHGRQSLEGAPDSHQQRCRSSPMSVCPGKIRQRPTSPPYNQCPMVLIERFGFSLLEPQEMLRTREDLTGRGRPPLSTPD